MNASGVDPDLLRAFVYIFRGKTEKTGQTATSAACSAHFEIQFRCAAISRAVWPVSFRPRLSLSLTLLKTLEKRACSSLPVSVESFRRTRTTAYHNKSGPTPLALMLATFRAYPVFTPQTFLLLPQRNPNSASPNELLLKRGRYRA